MKKQIVQHGDGLVLSAGMTIRILGEHPLAKDQQGRLISRIGTIFPRSRTIVTLPGIHATQRFAYVADLNAIRKLAGQPPLSEEDEMLEWQQSVDLIMDPESILIRPDPENMALAFEADDLLQELVSKQKIKFLNLMNEKVRYAIKERGENWRIALLPQSPDEMKRMIASAMLPIGGRSIYYYSRDIGTRFLTYQQFCELGALPDHELQAHLVEIRDFSCRYNRMGHPEVAFFPVDKTFGHSSFKPCEPMDQSPPDIRTCYEHLKGAFRDAVRPEMREDNPDNPDWRNPMFSCLIGQGGEALPEETILGLSSEFFMQIEWLPGGRIEEGELMFDSLFDEADRSPPDSDLRALCDEKARGFIFNFLREFGDVDYVNVGRVIGSLSRRPSTAGRRDVYVAEIKQLSSPRPVVRILRMQKWGIREHLNEGKDLLPAIMEAEDYTEYILDRRLGCRQLGMNLPSRITTRKISEHYHGFRYDSQQIWSTYFERDYLPGIATDKIPRSRFQNITYSLAFARLMGRAAAANIIVGRLNLKNTVLFDDGDEVIMEDEFGIPREIVVSDHTGTFMDYQSDLSSFAANYAEPIQHRLSFFPYPGEVMEAYLSAFLERFIHIKQDYTRRKRSFDMLFKQRARDERGSFAYRWERVLDRLNRTDPKALTDAIRKQFHI
jgi:hypothetical protein